MSRVEGVPAFTLRDGMVLAARTGDDTFQVKRVVHMRTRVTIYTYNPRTAEYRSHTVEHGHTVRRIV